MTLNEVMKNTADAIREKKGTTELIAPVDFAEEIKSISAGGGESGGSNWKYWRVDDSMRAIPLLASMMMVKVKDYPALESLVDDGDAIIPPAMFSMLGDEITYSAIKAMAADVSMKIVQMGLEMTIGDAITQNPEFEHLTEITEAEFYDLTT